MGLSEAFMRVWGLAVRAEAEVALDDGHEKIRREVDEEKGDLT